MAATRNGYNIVDNEEISYYRKLKVGIRNIGFHGNENYETIN